MLFYKIEERYRIEWRLINDTRINIKRGYKTLEEANTALDEIKRSCPVSFACIEKYKL